MTRIIYHILIAGIAAIAVGLLAYNIRYPELTQLEIVLKLLNQ